MTVGPDPDRLADAERRAAFSAEHIPGRSNRDGNRVLAFDYLADFVSHIHHGTRGEIAWALLWAEHATDLEPHEERLRERAWERIEQDADRAEWERLGLRR